MMMVKPILRAMFRSDATHTRASGKGITTTYREVSTALAHCCGDSQHGELGSWWLTYGMVIHGHGQRASAIVPSIPIVSLLVGKRGKVPVVFCPSPNRLRLSAPLLMGPCALPIKVTVHSSSAVPVEYLPAICSHKSIQPRTPFEALNSSETKAPKPIRLTARKIFLRISLARIRDAHGPLS